MTDVVTFVVAPVLGIIAIVAWVRRGQPVFANLGFRVSRWTIPDLVVGFVITALAILGVFLVELGLGVITVDQAPYDVSTFLSTFGDIAANAAVEEFFFRSLLLSGLVVVFGMARWGTNRWIPVLVSAVLFGLVHATNPGASALSVFGNALGGLIYGMAFLGAMNIWFPLALHLGWNFTQTLVGFPVSGKDFPGPLTTTSTGSDLVTGGDFGPEAGIIGILARFAVIGLLVGYLTLRYRDGSLAALASRPTRRSGSRKPPPTSNRRPSTSDITSRAVDPTDRSWVGRTGTPTPCRRRRAPMPDTSRGVPWAAWAHRIVRTVSGHVPTPRCTGRRVVPVGTAGWWRPLGGRSHVHTGICAGVHIRSMRRSSPAERTHWRNP